VTIARRPPGRAATDFWMLCHDDHTGRLLVAQRVADVGLASALLAELAFENRVELHDGEVVPVSTRPPNDAVVHQVLDQLHGEDRLPVQVWLRHLAQTSYSAMAGRMVRQRLVTEIGGRRGLFGRLQTVYQPTDPNVACWPAARLHIFLLERRVFTESDMFLVGLARATGLHRRAVEGGGRGAERYLDEVVTSAPAVLQELLAHTAAVVSSAVMTGH